MEFVQLPPILPGKLNLAALNLRLLSGEAQLDWSNVQEASKEHLRILLAGLDLVDASDALGLATVPDALAMDIVDVLSTTADARRDRDVSDQEQNEGEESETGQQSDAGEAGDASVPSHPNPSPAPTARREVLDAPPPSRLREMLEEMVVRDLLGPAGGEDEEVQDDRVLERYLVGMLAPDKQQTVPEELDELSSGEEGSKEDGAPDSGVAQKASLSPSSFGMSFNVGYDAEAIAVTARWGQYKKGESQTITTPKGHPARVWQRQQRSATRLIPLVEGPVTSWRPAEDEQPEVFVKGLVRRSSNAWTVTLFLVNGQHEPKRLRDEAWLFQPELIVEAPDGSPIFRSRNGSYSSTHEERAMSMLYRHHVGFAVGHGVSVHAETQPGDPTCAVRLSTRVIPSYDVPRTEAPTATELPALEGLLLDMKELAGQSDLPANLAPLVTAYAAWIEEQARYSHDPAADLDAYHDAAQGVLEQCRKTLRRIQQGIDMLGSNEDAARAFRFMNRAMWQQRVHTLYAEEKRRGDAVTLEELDVPANRSWRPFQLAFILLNLPALSDLHSPERGTDPGAVADLLWFPTGGGKTEAYLGLTAFTLAIRRLQGEIAGRSGLDGVAVIMRYTLRLLTLQQFQRASSLMCACELIRREESATWGETPFRLGLWVGQRSTPNTTQESEEAIRQDHGLRGKSFGGFGSMGNVGNPRQLTHCPWCGTSIEGGRHIEVESYGKGRGRTLMYCGDAYGQCAFSKAKSPGEGLPVLVVDEEIYRLLPALLIATVDKFAQLPWKGETQMLFGQVEKRCERHGFRAADIEDRDAHTAHGRFPRAVSYPHGPLRPPDLIIQDELHLISGPLGTLVGLYETGIDSLCTWEVDGRQVRPKIIAATATIRRASQQVEALFLRKVEIFPPQGLDVGDNFFSRQREPGEESPGRRYLGICANGRRMKAALIRVYIAYLAAAQALYEKYGAAADPYMTLVGYFNSMSELGGMRRLVDDDVSTRLWKMDQRGLAKRSRPIVEELTSRKSSSMIPEVLSRLELALGGNGEVRPIDVLLATNMISVGVDVKRLGLMVVTGQPKTTAEYIQATSRVGRNAPGLVCTVFNWSRPRDLSHYEQFEHYHATFYQQVEALSVTPFAPRALDRGLAALLTSYVRLAGTELSPNAAAGDVSAATAAFTRAREEIAWRAEEITASPEVAQRVRAELDRLQAYWVRQAATVPALGYKKRNDGRTLGLLQSPEQGRWEPFTCLNSLRDVEPGIHLILDERGLGEEEQA